MIKIGLAYETQNRQFAVEFVASVLRHASDWQEGQDALANHPTIGPWLRGTYGQDVIAEIQSIIRDAEERLGKELPY